MEPDATNHETEGLLSPVIRDVRLKQVARLIPPDSIVADIACGTGYLSEFLAPSCRYFGVDRIAPPDSSRFDSFINVDMAQDGCEEKINEILPGPADVVTMVAFIEHLKDPASIIRLTRKFLRREGRLILTTPHPIGRSLHDSLASIYLCSRAGAEEHETFFDRNDIGQIADESGFKMVDYRRFLFGLNQLAVFEPIE